MASLPAPAVLHVDLDGGRHIFRAHGWPLPAGVDRLFASGLEHTLELLAERNLRATLFVIAEDLEDGAKRELLREAVRRGHEIASHTVSHRRLPSLPPAERRRELEESRERLSGFSGVPVAGFRAPGFALDRLTLQQVAEAGYAWDSSCFGGRRRPGAALRAQATGPHVPLADFSLRELPLPGYDGLPVPFHPSYSLVFGTWYFRRGIRGLQSRQAPLVMLLHLTDLADPLPAHELPHWRGRIYTLSFLSAAAKRSRVGGMLDEVTRYYRWTDTATLMAQPIRPAGTLEGAQS